MIKAWTDYPFIGLGDKPNEIAQIRQVEVLKYDGNKYCTVFYNGEIEHIKSGYIYQQAGRLGDVSCLTKNQLESLI